MSIEKRDGTNWVSTEYEKSKEGEASPESPFRAQIRALAEAAFDNGHARIPIINLDRITKAESQEEIIKLAEEYAAADPKNFKGKMDIGRKIEQAIDRALDAEEE